MSLKPLSHQDQKLRLKTLAASHLSQVAKVAELYQAHEEAKTAWLEAKERKNDLAKLLATYVGPDRDHVLVGLEDGIVCVIRDVQGPENAEIHFIRLI